MLLIPCPHCGPRAEVEFRYAGEAHLSRRTEDVSDDDWAAYLYTRRNERGDRTERWRHIHGCGQFFNVLRSTVSDRIAASYLAGGPPPEGGA